MKPAYIPVQLLATFIALVFLSGTSCARDTVPGVVRVATFNIAMGLPEEGEFARRANTADDPGLQRVAEILQRIRPDVLLLNELDYCGDTRCLDALQDNYLAVSQNGQPPLDYPHRHSAPVNTGVDSGLDLDGNGQTGDAGDAWGFGRFPGQYGMAVLSRYPLDEDAVRSFRLFAWSDLPAADQPMKENGEPFYPPDTWLRLRLSSKSHWDIPITLEKGRVLHLLASHPTPPVFDGPEDRNGLRNQAEIRFWREYVSGKPASWIRDDEGLTGGLAADAHFVIAGDLNADPVDGETSPGEIGALLDSGRINRECTPGSVGGQQASALQGKANEQQRGNPAQDTADFNDQYTGNLRADYVLASSGLQVLDCGVYWPAQGEPGHDIVDVSDHRLVWVDIRIPE